MMCRNSIDRVFRVYPYIKIGPDYWTRDAAAASTRLVKELLKSPTNSLDLKFHNIWVYIILDMQFVRDFNCAAPGKSSQISKF